MTEALGAWGAFDRDNPFPLYGEVRELGAALPVTLADGHDAWLVVRHEEARADDVDGAHLVPLDLASDRDGRRVSELRTTLALPSSDTRRPILFGRSAPDQPVHSAG